MTAHTLLVPSQTRPVATKPMTAAEASSQILAKQRLNRPVAPHLSIYRPQINWYGSMFNRITGVVLSGGLYLYGLAYLVAPALGWHLGSASLAAGFAAWPVAAKFATKLFVALPFTYHSLNGLRHLMWDMVIGMSNKAIQTTGWAVVGMSVLSAIGLALL